MFIVDGQSQLCCGEAKSFLCILFKAFLGIETFMLYWTVYDAIPLHATRSLFPVQWKVVDPSAFLVRT